MEKLLWHSMPRMIFPSGQKILACQDCGEKSVICIMSV